MPGRVHLRTKRTVRCRRDFEQGKMSILVQPKQLPLEGDSSMKVHRGRWWVKDLSAIHFVPSVNVLKLPPPSAILSGNLTRVELLLTNPRDFAVSITIQSTCVNQRETYNESHPPIKPTLRLQLQPFPPCLLHEGEVQPGVKVVLGAHEDELLRDTHSGGDETGDEDSRMAAEMQKQKTALKNNGKEGLWLCSGVYNRARISIPLEGCNFAPDIKPESDSRMISQVAQLELRFEVSTFEGSTGSNVSFSPGGISKDEHSSYSVGLRVLIPL